MSNKMLNKTVINYIKNEIPVKNSNLNQNFLFVNYAFLSFLFQIAVLLLQRMAEKLKKYYTLITSIPFSAN